MTLSIGVSELFDGDRFLADMRLVVDDGVVAAVEPGAGGADVQIKGLAVPGFVDLQVNGGGGALFNADPSVGTLERIAAAHRPFGTAAILPTIITDTTERMEAAADAVAAALRQGLPGIAGIHFEGPAIAEARKGAHDQRSIRPLRAEELAILKRADIGARLLTLAPEATGPETIQALAADGVRVALGHSDCDAAMAARAFDAGASGVTHLFNAMSPLKAREPGLTGAALDRDDVSCGLILDGIHVAPETARIAYRCKPQGRLFFVTDAMPTLGTESDRFVLNGRTVLRREGRLTLDDGTLAGADLSMDRAVRNACDLMRADLGEALRMASLYPAAFMGLDDTYGRLAPGQRADFAVLDDALNVTASWIGGAPAERVTDAA